MINSPFSLFAPYAHRVRVIQCEKSDALLSSDTAPIRRAFGSSDIAALVQEHGSTIVRAEEPIDRTATGDGLLTDRQGLVLTIRHADCQSFVLYAPTHHVAGVLHVGWRGILCDAIGAWFSALTREWGILPRDVFVGAGPSLCTSCADFSDPLRELPGLSPALVSGRTVNLRAAAEAQFVRAGLPMEHFERMEDCTRCTPNRWWTYRGGDAEAVKAGYTNVLAIMLL